MTLLCVALYRVYSIETDEFYGRAIFCQAGDPPTSYQEIKIPVSFIRQFEKAHGLPEDGAQIVDSDGCFQQWLLERKTRL